jgi:hypothetical protein
MVVSQYKLTNKGNKMQSVKITTVKVNSGLVHEFVYECHNEATLMAVINGTMEGCSNTGWAMSAMEVI